LVVFLHLVSDGALLLFLVGVAADRALLLANLGVTTGVAALLSNDEPSLFELSITRVILFEAVRVD
jgi:hypothetical protein